MNFVSSEYDIKTGVTIPSLDDELLAYETGVHIGDGSLQIVAGGTHSVRYFGHSQDDWIFYAEVVPKILNHLYNKDARPTKRLDANTCTLSLCSKAVATFKRDELGLPNGNKNQLIGLPQFVKKDKKLLASCLRGIADADFSLFFANKGGSYSHPTISCTMSNKALIMDLEQSLKGFGFSLGAHYDVQRQRNGKTHLEHVLTICGKSQLQKWMDEIGFSNPKHKTKFDIWKKLGYCLPRQSTEQRITLISGF